jgi:hypothetical protein
MNKVLWKFLSPEDDKVLNTVCAANDRNVLMNTNNQIHNVHIWFKTNLHPPTANFTKVHKVVYYSEIKIFNSLSHETKDLTNEIKQFWNALKRSLLISSFYNSEEHFNY